jgi:hypothetical protein
VPLDAQERALLDRACAAVPPPARPPAIGTDADYPNFVENLMLTVLDLQLHNVIVNNAITHYRTHRRDEVGSLDDLEAALSRYSADAVGNREAATYLWGYKYGDRLGHLRSLTAWARDNDILDQSALMAWAYRSNYRRDWFGQIKGLGPAAYCWLLMRMGVDIVKPDTWLHRFLRQAVGRDLEDMDLVEEICASAGRVGRKARELDGGIWEAERGGPGSI